MSKWRKISIGEFVEFNPSEKINKGAVAKKIPMAMLTEFERKIKGFELSQYQAGPKFKNGDTLVAKITPCLENGKTAQVDILDDNEVAFGSSEFIVLRENENSINDYIFYLAKSPVFRERAIGCMEGTSGRKRVNEGALKRQEIVVPDKSTQQKIASVLSALDDKIELNNKINAELEAMAKTIYDYWFVQFDFPDANGKPYKSSGGKMIYNDVLKREVPDGWDAGSLNKISNITMGQSPSGDSYNENKDGVIFFQGSTDFGWRFPSVRQFTTAPTRFAKQGDILLSVRAPVGTMNVADFDCCIGRGLAALHSNSGNDGFLFYTVLGLKIIFDRRNVDGTTFGSITKDDLHSLKIIIPTKELQDQYEQKVKSANKIILNNHKQNQQLSQLRDWLLPMLMNGQVTVGQAYEQVQEVLGMAAEDAAVYKK